MIQKTVGIYAGKEFKGEGKKKDGTPYKRYRLSFKPNFDSSTMFGMILFMPMKNSQYNIDTVQEGVRYTIDYDTHPYISNSGIPAQSKTIVSLSDVKPSDNMVQAPLNATPIPELNLNNFESFLSEYLDVMRKNNMNPNAVHMLGSYIATHEKDRVKFLIEKCKAACLAPIISGGVK